MPTRVLIADASPVCIYGLEALLSRDPNIVIVGKAADGDDAVRLALALRPDIFLAEIELPRLGGIAAFTRIRQTLPAIRGMFLTRHANSRCRQLAIEARAAAFLTKDSDLADLAEMITAVGAGRSYLRSPATVNRDPDTKSLDHDRSRSVLSEREIFVLRKLVEGLSSREIAELLGRSPRTVDKQRESLRLKLDIHNTASLVAFGVVFLQEFDLLRELDRAFVP